MLPLVAIAQIGNEKYEKGLIILSNGDTLNVTIKPERPERMSKQINVWDDQMMGNKRYLPKDLIGYVFQGETFTVKKDEEGKKVFMRVDISGHASLYSYTYKEVKGKKEVVTDYYLEKKGSGLVKVPSSKNKFRNEISYYFADDLKLAQKIDDKMYQYNDIEAIVDEYNENKEAKLAPLANNQNNQNNQNNNQPENNQENPNQNNQNNQPYTHNDNNNNGNNNSTISNPTDNDEIYPILRDNVSKAAQKSMGIEVFGAVSYNIMSYPNMLNSIYRVKSGGVGFDVGVGFRATVSRGLTFRVGINMKDKAFKFESNSLQIVDNNGAVTVLTVKESGRTYYPGLYFNIGQEWKYFMIGGGFNASFYSTYRGNYEYSGGPYQGKVDKSKTSFMVHDINRPDGSEGNFNMQFDINLTAGGRIPIGDRFTLKPFVQYSIPMISLYNSGITTVGATGNVELNVQNYAIKIGLIADFGNW